LLHFIIGIGLVYRELKMKQLNFHKLVPFIVTTIIFTMIVFLQMQRKTVLILHSYNTDYSWVRDVNEGIKRVLKEKSFVNVSWHYMNTKNHPELSYKQKAGAIARKVTDFVNPTILFAVDDDAQELVAQFYKDRPNMYIVYAGVNALPERYGYEKAKNVVGILERIPINGVKDAVFIFAKQMGLKGTPIVCHVADKSLVVQFDDYNLHHSKDWAPIILGPSFLVETFDEWKKAILEADKYMDFMMISNYRKIARSKSDPKFVPYQEAMHWAFANSPVLIIGINAFVCEDGAAISVATSPFEQGEIAMQMVLDLASGRRKIEEIKNTQSGQYIIVMNEARFNTTKLHLPGIYKAFAKAINRYEVNDK
jgi:ABC-type uncharacterized transport system substrate-binding protein